MMGVPLESKMSRFLHPSPFPSSLLPRRLRLRGQSRIRNMSNSLSKQEVPHAFIRGSPLVHGRAGDMTKERIKEECLTCRRGAFGVAELPDKLLYIIAARIVSQSPTAQGSQVLVLVPDQL
jgi:hypothetical protein